MLWPLLKRTIRIKYSLFGLSRRKARPYIVRSSQIQEVAAESMRIRLKLHETEQLIAAVTEQPQNSHQGLPERKDNDRQTLKIILLVMLISALQPNTIIAQVPSNLKPLKIGDKVPDLIINNLINYKSSSAKLSDFKGKLLILDFWATWCSACFHSFPKLDSLQQQFPNKLQILRVAFEEKEKVLVSLARRSGPDAQPNAMTTLVNDTTLRKLFPHRLVPHYVWIGPDGVFKATTSGEEVTLFNIRSMIDESGPAMQVKTDLDKTRPLFMAPEIHLDSILHYSVFTKGAYNGLGTGSIVRKTGGIVRGRAMTNSTIYDLYQCAAIGLFKKTNNLYSAKRILTGVADSLAIRSIKRIDKKADLYNYELVLPVQMAGDLYDRMLKDLNLYTPFEGKIEKRNVRCLVLKVKGSTEHLQSKGGNELNTLFGAAGGELKNGTINYLVIRLNDLKNLKLPVIDETAYTGKIDLKLRPFSTLQSLQQELKFYGLELEEAERELEMFILEKDASAAAEANR